MNKKVEFLSAYFNSGDEQSCYRLTVNDKFHRYVQAVEGSGGISGS